MAAIKDLSAPFLQIANMLWNDSKTARAFLPDALRKQFVQQATDPHTPPEPPSLNLSVPGIPQILNLIPG